MKLVIAQFIGVRASAVGLDRVSPHGGVSERNPRFELTGVPLRPAGDKGPRLDAIGIIQARLGSTRLPGKILAPIAGRPMLELIAERLRESRVTEWWLATSSDTADDATECWGHTLGLQVFRGENEDVLSRFTAIIHKREPEWIVRVTADNPFVSGEAVDLLLDARADHGKERALIEFAGDEHGLRQLPLGFGLQLARAKDVIESESQIPDREPHHRAHVLSWLARRSSEELGAEKCCPVPGDWPARPDWRWTVDTFEDLTMARAAFESFGRDAVRISYPDMVACLDEQPRITSHNQAIKQKSLVEG